MSEKRSKEFVLDQKETADDRRRPDADKWVNYARLYKNEVDRDASEIYQAQITIPWPYIIIETYLPKSVQFLLGALPYVSITAEHANFDSNALFTEKLINKQLWLQNFVAKTARIFKNAFIYGSEFVQIEPWTQHKGMPMPMILPTRIFDIWVNPYVSDLNDPTAWLVHRTFKTMKEIKAMAWRANFRGVEEHVHPVSGAVMREVITEPVYKNLEKIKPKEGANGANPFGDRYAQELDAIDGKVSYLDDRRAKMVELLTYYDRNRIITVANENTVIRDTENPIGRIPFFHLTPTPNQWPEFYGMSILEPAKQLFMELNEVRSQIMDAATRILNPMWETQDRAMHGKKLLSAPGRIIYSEYGGLKKLDVDYNALVAGQAREQAIIADIMDATNTFLQVRGAPMERREPATTTLKMQEAGDIRSNMMNIMLESQYVEAIAEAFVEFNRKFLSVDLEFQVPDGSQQRVKVQPQQLFGDFSYKAQGGAMLAREVERKQYMEMMGMVFSNPMFQPLVMPKASEWLKRLFYLYPSIHNPETLYQTMDPDQLMKAQVQARAFEQLASGAGQGSGDDKVNTTPALMPGEGFANSPMDSVSNSGAWRQ